jgi:hypothetical protein
VSHTLSARIASLALEEYPALAQDSFSQQCRIGSLKPRMSKRSPLPACSLLLLIAITPALLRGQAAPQKPAQQPLPKPAPQSQPSKTPAVPPSPQSTHYPILLLGHGADPFPWTVLIGQKGPERFDRANYPPIALDAVNVAGEGAADAWAYHAKDSATGADVTIHLTREGCIDAPGSAAMDPASKPPAASGKPAAAASVPPLKNSFRMVLEHAEAGTFRGCARIAAELFPKIVNQSADDDDADKKKPPVATITNFKTPTAVAYLNPAGKIVVSRGAAKKIAPTTGTELAVSHDGKKLLFTRNDAKMGSERTIVLYDFDTGRSKDLLHGTVRQAFWSPDDSRVAYLQSQDQKWRILSSPISAPETATALNSGSVDSLDGWIDGHTLIAADAQNLYWVADDRPQQSIPLREIYGTAFRVSDSDTIRVNPVNADLLLVSAKYVVPPASAPADASGVFLYEVKSKRRITLTPPEQWSANGEWSRDGIQIFYTRRMSATSSVTFRVFWDASGARKYLDGTDLVVGQ